MKTLQSTQDDSVNFIFDEEPGYFEARYVRRSEKYFALYLSSQSGCAQACRMCHLTATKQAKFVNASQRDFERQADAVFDWYDKRCPKAEAVHFNFMARGEALDNHLLLDHSQEILMSLGQKAVRRGLVPRFLFSTIMPKSVAGVRLARTFPLISPEFYYSIYSTREAFRKKWLPKAMPVTDALNALREYQEDKKVVIKLHWALIKGENDSADDVYEICDAVKNARLHANFALVQYNPYSPVQGEESDEATVLDVVSLISKLMPESRVKRIRRIGHDVKASCGMFVTKTELTQIAGLS